MKSIDNLTVLKNLVYLREQIEIQEMTEKVRDEVLEKGKKFFNVWMYEINDQIQSLASAYAERFFLQSAVKAYQNDCLHNGTR